MNRVIFLAGLAVLFRLSASVDAQALSQPAPTVQTIEACRISLTEAGQAASFQGTAVYEAALGSDGRVLEVRPVKIPDVFNTFVRLAEFRGCVQRWKFSGPGTTLVALNAGTTGELLSAWKVSVSSGTRALTLILPLTVER